jgi:conjugal transfer pilus assembly protein TraV
MKRIVLLVVIFGLCGCRGLINPYKEEFQCPDTYKGDCVSLQHAYEKTERKAVTETRELDPALDFRRSQFEYYKSNIEQPQPITIVPPKAVRVLILPYRNDQGFMVGHRYNYLFVSEPQFLLPGHDTLRLNY